MTQSRRNLLLYMAKCVAAVGATALARLVLSPEDAVWFLISVILVLSPVETEAMSLALTRIKANFTGAAASLVGLGLIILLHLPQLAALALALALTVALCAAFRILEASRPALAAAVIIILYGAAAPGAPLWEGPLNRLISVIAGCLAGLAITTLVHLPFRGRANPA